MPSFLNKIINIARRKETDHDDLKSPKLGSTEMRAGTSAPSPTSPKFFDDPARPYPDVNASNGGSRTLGPRSKHKSEEPLRIAQLWKGTTSPPASPRSPTTSTAPKLDLDLIISTSIPHQDEKGVEEKNDGPDEFGALLLVPDRDRFTMLSDEDIAAKSLTPEDVSGLVQAASAVIHAQGLETLGVFHPHWLSASPSSQRELISRYVASLPSTSSTAAQDSFRSTLEQAQPTDVAAVLKWGFRHMVLEEGTFGGVDASSSNGWGWYVKFAEAERMSSFPTDAFSKQLLPLLPPSHANLLKDLLDLLSSVAAHAQGNGMFNTKLCKVLAWWVVCSRKWGVQDESKDTWTDFYDAWDRCSRILEHIMLAYLRDQSRDARGLPVRLVELHTPYPPPSAALASYTFTSNSFPLPPRPRLTTQTYGALLVRLESPHGVKPRQPRDNPIRLLEEALDARPVYTGLFSNPYHSVWSEIRADVARQRARAATPLAAVADVASTHTVNAEDDETATVQMPTFSPVLSILSDTTVRWLSLVAPPPPRKNNDKDAEPITPTIAVSTFADTTTPHVPPSEMFRRKTSFSLSDSPTTYPGSMALGVLHENETGQQALPTGSPQNDHRLSLAPSVLTVNGKATGMGELGSWHEMLSSTSLASFVPEEDEYLKSFSTAGFLSPSQDNGLGTLGGEAGGLAQTLVQPSAFGSPTKSGSGNTSSSDGQGGSGQGGKNERRSLAASPLKRRITAASSTSTRSGRAGGRPSTDIQNGTGTSSSTTPRAHSASEGSLEDVTVLAVPPTRIELDEAFVDTWADTILDERMASIPQAWPNFALFQLKTPRTAGVLNGGEPIEWLVVEQHVCTTAPPPPASPVPPESQGEGSKEGRLGKGGKKMKRSTSPSGASARSAGTFRLGVRARNRLSHFFGFSSSANEDAISQAPPSPSLNPPSISQTVTPLLGERDGASGSATKKEDDEDFDVRKVSPPLPPDSTDPVPFPRTGGSSLVDESEEPEPISDTEAEAVISMTKNHNPTEPAGQEGLAAPKSALVSVSGTTSTQASTIRAREPEQENTRKPEPASLVPAREPSPAPALAPATEPEPEPLPEPALGPRDIPAAAVALTTPAAVEEPKAAKDNETKVTDPADIPILPTPSYISD